jgi:hypothetical protein
MVGGQIPVRKLVGDEGKGVGEHEEVEGNLLVCSVGAGVAGFELPAVSRSSGVMWVLGGGGPVRGSSVGKLGSTSRSRVTHLEPRFGPRRSGMWGSTARSSGGANGGVVVLLRHVCAGARCSPFIGARERGGGAGRDTTEGGAAGTRLRQGRGVVARPSGIDGRVARASWQGWDTGHGKSPAAGPVGGWSGPVGGRALARLAGPGMPCRVAGLLCQPEQSRGGERRERDGENGRDSN